MTKKTYRTLILTDILAFGAYTLCMIMDNLYRQSFTESYRIFSSPVHVAYMAGKIFEILGILIIPLAFLLIAKNAKAEHIRKVVVVNALMVNAVAVPLGLFCNLAVPVQEGSIMYIVPFALSYTLSHIILGFATKNTQTSYDG